MDCPCGFRGSDGTPKLFRLTKSLYELHQSLPKVFDKLTAGLLEWGFIHSKLYSCLFITSNVLCLVYLNDIIFAASREKAIESKTKTL